MTDLAKSKGGRSNKNLLKRHSLDLTITCMPVVLMLPFFLTRPLYMAGRVNSIGLLFAGEINVFLIVLSPICGFLWLASRLAVHLGRRRFKAGLVCGVLACVIICTFLIFRSIGRSSYFRFEYGFREWVLENADLEAIEAWRSTLESTESEYPMRISEKDWPNFVTVLSPHRVDCYRLEHDRIELILGWRGVGRSWGLAFCPKGLKPQIYRIQLQVSPQVYFWTFSTR